MRIIQKQKFDAIGIFVKILDMMMRACRKCHIKTSIAVKKTNHMVVSLGRRYCMLL